MFLKRTKSSATVTDEPLNDDLGDQELADGPETPAGAAAAVEIRSIADTEAAEASLEPDMPVIAPAVPKTVSPSDPEPEALVPTASTSVSRTAVTATDRLAALSTQESAHPGLPSVLSQGVYLEGKIRTPGPFHMEGAIKGSVEVPLLVLGERGMIEGELGCLEARINGTVDGNIQSKIVAVGASGVVRGTLACDSLSLISGATINATVSVVRPRNT